MNTLGYSFRMLRRDSRAGELRVLFLALVIAIGSVTSVGFFTDRIQQALKQQANELLAADLVVTANNPIRSEFLKLANQFGLQAVKVMEFRSMVLAGDKNVLAEVKAVQPGYPLRGHLKIANHAFGKDFQTNAVPEPGHAWVEADLLRRLGIKAGDTVTLGAIQLVVNKVLTYEPDRGGSLFSIAPRLLMNIKDVPATQLIQPGSRVKYSLLLAGDPQAISKFHSAAAKILKRGEKLVEVTDARQEVRAALSRSQRFLGLAALVSVVLAGVAVAMATRRYVQRHLDNCAVMRCLGATQNMITRVYLLEMFWLGLLASLTGCLVGYFAHVGLVEILGRIVVTKLPASSLMPVVYGLGTGMVTLLAFALPPLMHLKNVPTLRVIRRELGALQTPAFSAYLIGFIAISALLVWQSGEIRLGLYVLGGLLGTIAVLYVLAFLLLRFLRVFRNSAGVTWRFGLANISRRAQGSVIQILAFGVGIMALLLLTVVRSDLLTGWEGKLPQNAPNRFIINIQPDQVQAAERFFKQAGFPAPDTFPMVRARLISINDVPVVASDYEDARARRLVEREFNLSWTADLQPDNKVVKGRWWTKDDFGKKEFSMEEGIAKTIGVKLGDVLTFSVAGEQFSARVVNLREVQWDSFHVNFFLLTPPGVLEDYPATYVTSFYLPENNAALIDRLVQHFPNFTVIDVSAIMNKVRDIIYRVTDAIQYVFMFTLLAGVMVLYAAIQATHDERARESAILRTLGANRRQLVLGLISEFITLGLLSGVVAALAASLLGYVLAERVLDVPYSFDPWLWLWGLVGGGAGVGISGFLGTRSILKRPPLQTLRRL